MDLSKKLSSIAPSVTLQITAKANELKAKGRDVLSFAAGEPDFDTPDFIKNAAVEALKKGFTKYTPASGTAALKEAAAAKFKKDNGIDYSPDQIIVSCGAKHSLFNAFAALLNGGDEVVIPAPYWLSYPEMVKSLGGVPVILETSMDREYKLDIGELREKLTPKTKALVLNSPSNPTGSVYDKAELKSIADLAVEKNFFVISDEIYEKLIYDGEEHVSIASFHDAIKDKTITINGMSKAYSMTGWRLGYLGAPKTIAKMINAFQSHTTSNPTSFAQAGGLEALTNPKSAGAINKMLEAFSRRRNTIFELLSGIDKIKPLKPKGAFYVFCDISATKLSSVDFATQLLEAKDVAVIPGAAFGADGCIRLSFATSEDVIREGMNRIKDWLN